MSQGVATLIDGTAVLCGYHNPAWQMTIVDDDDEGWLDRVQYVALYQCKCGNEVCLILRAPELMKNEA